MILFWAGGFHDFSRWQFKVKPWLSGDVEVYELASRVLGQNTVLVADLVCEDVFSRDCLSRLRRVDYRFLAESGVMDVKSLTNSVIPQRRGLRFAFRPLIPSVEMGERDRARIRDFALQHPLIRNVMVSSDGRHTLMTVLFRGEMREAGQRRAWIEQVDQIRSQLAVEGIELTFGALPLFERDLRASLEIDARKYAGWLAVAVTVVLLVCLRSWRLTLYVLLNEALFMVLLVALLIGISTRWNTGIELLPILPLLGSIQLALLIHVAWAMRLEARHTADPRRAALEAVKKVGKACLFASLTSAMGLFSIALFGTSGVRQFGLIGGFGALGGFGLAFGPGIALLPLLGGAGRCQPNRHDVENLDREPGKNARFGRFSTVVFAERRTLVCLLFILAVGVALPGWLKVSIAVRPMDVLPLGSEVRRFAEILDADYGGFQFFRMEVDCGAEGALADPEVLRYLERVEQYARGRSEVTDVYSYTQVLAMLNQIWEGNDSNALRLPENPWLLRFFALALKTGDLPFLTPLTDAHRRTAYLFVRSREVATRDYLALIDEITGFARGEASPPQRVTVLATEGMDRILGTDLRILREQVGSVMAAIAGIGILLVVLWHSVVLAAIAVSVITVSTSFLFAVSGAMGMTLNSVTASVAAVVLGVAVDDAVHFLTSWQHAHRLHGDSPRAIVEALNLKGGPIVSTSILLVLAFGLLGATSFPVFRHYGILAASGFVAALIGVLAGLPIILGIWRQPPIKQKSRRSEA